jgi:hypothetical protein
MIKRTLLTYKNQQPNIAIRLRVVRTLRHVPKTFYATKVRKFYLISK